MRLSLGTALLLLSGRILACDSLYEPPCSRIHQTDNIFLGRVKDDGGDGGGHVAF
jgi:hypothetical protein